MLDRNRPGVERRDDTGIRLRMHGDIGAVTLGLLDARREFCGAVCRREQRIGEAGHAAPRHELDLGSAAEQVVAHRSAHLVRAVGDLRPTEPLGDAGPLPAVEVRVPVIGRPEITMPRGLTDRRTAGVDAWAGEHAGIQCLLKAEGVAAHVPHRREAGHQVIVRTARRADRLFGDVLVQHHVQKRRRIGDVPVSLDHARHQRAPAAVDDIDLDLFLTVCSCS